MERKRPLLLHSCCGPCSTAVVERLAGDYEITLFFYNPNITDQEEYEKRRDAQLLFLRKYNEGKEEGQRVRFLEGAYEPRRFLEVSKGLEQEPEGGKRCAACFRLRLSVSAETARGLGSECFGTTLSVSPHKDHALLCQIGEELSRGGKVGRGVRDLTFLTDDFKKKDGYRRSIQLSKEYGLYRQSFCGCEFARLR